MTENEKDIQEFEEAFGKGRYGTRFSLVAQRADVISVIKDWMLEMWLTSRQSLRGEITRLQGIIDGYYILNGDLSLGATKLREENKSLKSQIDIDFQCLRFSGEERREAEGLTKKLKAENERLVGQAVLWAKQAGKGQARIHKLELEIARLRGESPDAGGKSLRRER